jgi:hypothetical protein
MARIFFMVVPHRLGVGVPARSDQITIPSPAQ